MKYLRVTYKNGQVSSQIIAAAKTRVSPVKVITIPRLELMSSLLLVRLVHSVYSALTRRFLILKFLCLTDSAITLTWIQNEKKRYKQFVQNCVRELGGYVRDMCQEKKILQLCHRQDVLQKRYYQREAIGLMVQVGCHSKFQLGQYLKISTDLQIKKKRSSSKQKCEHRQF